MFSTNIMRRSMCTVLELVICVLLSSFPICVVRAGTRVEAHVIDTCYEGTDDVRLMDMTYPKCVDACRARGHCVSINHVGRMGFCVLHFADADVVLCSTLRTMYSRKADWAKQTLHSDCSDCYGNETTCVQDAATGRHTCQVTECKGLASPDFGKLLGNMWSVGSRVKFTCSEYYKFEDGVSSPTRTCLDTGQWSGMAPICIVRCPDKVDVVFGDSCYFFSKGLGPHDQAKGLAHCQSKHPKAHHLVYDTQPEYERINQFLTTKHNGERNFGVWYGAVRRADGKFEIQHTHELVTNDFFTDAIWGDNQPKYVNDKCSILLAYYDWFLHDFDCTYTPDSTNSRYWMSLCELHN